MDELGFPLWLRAAHFINLFCMLLLIRSGIQILADHPKLYWNDDARPDSEWIKFGKKVMPKDRLWTSMDEAETVSSTIGLPGGHHNLGAGRRWHFLTVLLWIANGIVYLGLLFITGNWRRLIPTSWDILPAAWNSFITFATFHIPPESSFHPYDPLQQLTYAVVVFLIAPMMVLTGLCMSPAFIARFPWYPRLFGGRQAARSLHFIGLLLLLGYIVLHVSLVLIVHFYNNIGNMVFGEAHYHPELAAAIAGLGLLGILAFHVIVTRWTLGYQRTFQILGDRILEPVIRFLFGRLRSRQDYHVSEITPRHRVNGYPPTSDEYKRLADDGFNDWRLRIEGLVANPFELSLKDLHGLPQQAQITKHNCIQGWSGVAEWGGVPMREIIKLCKPLPEAQYAAFYAFMQAEYVPHSYYETLTMNELQDPQTILAHEMNWKPLPIEHGAPCRLRVETKTGYKMVKFLTTIIFLRDVSEAGEGYGGYREDHQYYDKVASI